MLTVFSTPKPFEGHFAMIQRNAIRSWTLLHPDCEVILFGDEEGTEAVASEFGVRHIPHVKRNEYGTPFISDLFDQAQQLGVHDTLCYVNCDTILLSDLIPSVERAKRKRRFLMVGRRWGLRVTDHLDFGPHNWEEQLRTAVKQRGSPGHPSAIEYFVFNRGLWGELPPLVVGRPRWDNYMLYRARSRKAALIDASSDVTAIHQDHDYSHHPKGREGVWNGVEAQRNHELMGTGFTTEHSTHLLTGEKLRVNWSHLNTLPLFYPSLKLPLQIFWKFLDISRPVRSVLGLRLKSSHAKSPNE
jgi:hypothetical protein